jgi:Raf kinase inhibitor-like YbhB/YbcL family protein
MKSNASRPLGSILSAVALLLLPILTSHAADPPPRATLNITSSGFPAEGMMPAKYGCEGANASPALSWTGVPAGAKSLVLICDDPDAPGGTWVHWVLFNLPANTSALAEKVDTAPMLPSGARQGVNDFGKIGYSGPCPPPGKPHHYFFKLYALDIRLGLKPGATKKELLQAMDGHIVGEGLLMGKYQRKK